MNRKVLENGLIRLTGTFKDARTGKIHSEVECKPEDEKFFVPCDKQGYVLSN